SGLKKYTPEYAEAITGIKKEAIIVVAELIGKKKNVFFAWTMGINHGIQGTQTVSAVNTLALLTGNIGRTGAAPMSITGQCNAMGTREFGFASSMPGYRAFGNSAHKKELAKIWNLNPEEITDVRGKAYPDIIDGIIAGEIKGLWIIGTNPFVSFPDTNRLQSALKSLEFIAVQDGFTETPTTQAAHLLLPAAIWGEKDGTYTNMERRISRARAAVSPAGEAKSDFRIFMDLAETMGIAETIFSGWNSPENAFNEMRKISEGRLNDMSGITYDKLDRFGGIQWPCNNSRSGGTDSLYVDGKFQTKNKKAILTFAEQQELPEKAEDLYPLNLNTGRTVEHWHTGTKTAKTPILQYLSPCPYAEVHPETAKKYSVKNGEKVSVVSRRGRIDGVLIRVTEIIRKDEIFIPFHFKDARVNSLTIAAFDPISREPNYKQSAVRIEKK
ncbi:MAG: molybdopterin oxidoreductase family protein, partial [Spirochaetia bacterium]|nr:molybdopterin oxidoreductase family protein [Spirochaetia bacterium]